jgi:hypothetical protein
MISHKEENKRRTHLVLLAVLIILLMGYCRKNTTLSEDMFGIWKASDIKYKDSFFEIQEEFIVFSDKKGGITNYSITDVRKEDLNDGEWVLYTILYQDKDFLRREFSFYYHPSNESVIMLKNQPTLVWKKEAAD